VDSLVCCFFITAFESDTAASHPKSQKTWILA